MERLILAVLIIGVLSFGACAPAPTHTSPAIAQPPPPSSQDVSVNETKMLWIGRQMCWEITLNSYAWENDTVLVNLKVVNTGQKKTPPLDLSAYDSDGNAGEWGLGYVKGLWPGEEAVHMTAFFFGPWSKGVKLHVHPLGTSGVRVEFSLDR